MRQKRRQNRLKFERSFLSRVGAFGGRNCRAQNAFSSFSRHFRLFLSLAQFVAQFSRLVRRFFNAIDSDDPVLGRVRFFHVLQLVENVLFEIQRGKNISYFYVFVADFDVSDSIEAGHLRVSADFAEPEKIEFFEEQIRANSTPQTGNYFSFIAAKKKPKTKNRRSNFSTYLK